MKNGWGGFNVATQLVSLSEGKLTREDRYQCWETWKEANEVIKTRRQELWESNYNYFRSKTSDALNTAYYGDPREAKSKVKDVQREMKGTQMSKPQFQEIHDLLDDAWQKATLRGVLARGRAAGGLRSRALGQLALPGPRLIGQAVIAHPMREDLPELRYLRLARNPAAVDAPGEGLLDWLQPAPEDVALDRGTSHDA